MKTTCHKNFIKIYNTCNIFLIISYFIYTYILYRYIYIFYIYIYINEKKIEEMEKKISFCFYHSISSFREKNSDSNYIGNNYTISFIFRINVHS